MVSKSCLTACPVSSELPRGPVPMFTKHLSHPIPTYDCLRGCQSHTTSRVLYCDEQTLLRCLEE
ncbi:hypothetical protein LIA77_11128 [Sarocladium implicatum]|nr:hypothetical protein LIA77_11128 [Sarocladium implicatum]